MGYSTPPHFVKSDFPGRWIETGVDSVASKVSWSYAIRLFIESTENYDLHAGATNTEED